MGPGQRRAGNRLLPRLRDDGWRIRWSGVGVLPQYPPDLRGEWRAQEVL
jgi:hypothetical protein